MNTLFTMHNAALPGMPVTRRGLVWVDVGHAVQISDNTALSVSADKQDDSDVSELQLRIHRPSGAMLAASPEDLSFLTTDAVVRCVQSDRHGPVRVLVEIGDMVAFPTLREVAA